MACRWAVDANDFITPKFNVPLYLCNLRKGFCISMDANRASCSIPHLKQYNVCGHIKREHRGNKCIVYLGMYLCDKWLKEGYRHDGTRILCPKCVKFEMLRRKSMRGVFLKEVVTQPVTGMVHPSNAVYFGISTEDGERFESIIKQLSKKRDVVYGEIIEEIKRRNTVEIEYPGLSFTGEEHRQKLAKEAIKCAKERVK